MPNESPNCPRCRFPRQVLPYGDVWHCSSCGHQWPREFAPKTEPPAPANRLIKLALPLDRYQCLTCNGVWFISINRLPTLKPITALVICPFCASHRTKVYDQWTGYVQKPE